MKFNSLFVATAISVALAASAAHAAPTVVNNTELGTVLAPGTTTTNANGTTSTNANTAVLTGEAPATDQWIQNNLRGGGVAGITDTYARSGNGSFYFSTNGDGSSKGDMEYYFGTPKLLSDFEGGTYDWYRDGSSTVGPAPAPSYRLAVVTSTNLFAGYFVFEPYLNGSVPTNTWETETINVNSSLFWSTNANANLPTACANRQACLYTINDLSAANAGMKVVGFSTGAGSGWNGGTFKGGVDNFGFDFKNEGAQLFNAEVAAVPEPGTWALMILGFGGAGAMIRRQKTLALAV